MPDTNEADGVNRQDATTNPDTPSRHLSRRDFLATAAVAAAATYVGGCQGPGPQPFGTAMRPGGIKPEQIRVGIIGCGGRGTGAAIDCVQASSTVEIVALGDLFPDRLERSRNKLNEEVPDAVKVADEQCFTGFDAYKGVLACDLELAILATPPGFRPLHLQAAVEAGKHIFTEKPVAVDPVGVRSVIATSELAQQKGLAIVAGTQRRHEPPYLEIMRRVHRGDIGEIVGGQCYWNQGELWVKEHDPAWTEMEWQCRNWLYFTWLSGDHIVEQHVHNLDVMNWALRATPVKAVGMGGRQSRTGPEFGNIYDHFSVEYEYPNGVRVLSMCRQVKGASERVSERLVGTRGTVDFNSFTISRRHRSFKYEFPAEPVNPYVQEHVDLLASIRAGRPLNEGRRVAESTLTAIMGRMSAYTGREISWDWVMNASKLDLSPQKYAMGDIPVHPVAIPGETTLA